MANAVATSEYFSITDIPLRGIYHAHAEKTWQ